MRQFLSEQGFTEVRFLLLHCTRLDEFLQQMTPDHVVLLLVQDNIDLACRVIEKAAMDRAIADVDENFAPSYELRRRHRQVSITSKPVHGCQVDFPPQANRGQPFWDASALSSNFSANLPDPLRIKAAGVQANQINVYEDFGKSRLLDNETLSFNRP